MKLSKGLEFLISQMVIPGDTVPVEPVRDVPPAPSTIGEREIMVGEDRVILVNGMNVVVLPVHRRRGL